MERYWYKDEYNMMLIEGNERSWRDSIGRNFDAYMSKYRNSDLLDGVWSCFEFKEPHEWLRHPGNVSNDLSRDHIIYAILLFIKGKQYHRAQYILNKLKWRVNKTTRLNGMFLWSKVMKYKFGYNIYYMFKLPGIFIRRLQNHLVRKWANINPELSQPMWDLDMTRNRTERQRKAKKLVYPAYALHIAAWQLNVFPNSKFKALLQRQMLPLVGEHNYVIKTLLGHKLTKEELSFARKYKSMTGSRWTTTLDELNDRHVEIIKPEEMGDYDLEASYLKYIIKHE